MALGNTNIVFRYIVEVTPGTTPSTPTMVELGTVTGESLTGTVGTVTSEAIRDDRQIPDHTKVTEGAGGDINFEFKAETYDDFMEACFQGTWSTNVLVNGTTKRAFSIEKEVTNVSEFFMYTGMEVAAWNLSMPVASLVTSSFTFMGFDETGTSSTGASVSTADNTNSVMNTSTDIDTITLDGGALSGTYLTSMDLTFDNGMREQKGIGTTANIGIGSGRFNVTGSITLYFDDIAFYNKFKAGTKVDLGFRLIKDSQSYLFDIPNVGIADGTVNAGAADEDLLQTYALQVIMKADETYTVKITRVP